MEACDRSSSSRIPIVRYVEELRSISAEARMFRKRSVLIVLFVIAAACGGGTEDSEAADTTATEPTVATVPPTTAPIETTVAPMVDQDDSDHEEDMDDGAHEEDADDPEHEDDDAESDEDGVAAGRVVDVSMTEFAFDPSDLMVTAGETITFRVSNDGLIVHELRLSNAHRIEEHLAEGHADHDETDGDHHGDADVVLELEAGESGELTVTFPEDTTIFTEMACLIPGHYEGGMKGGIAYG
jgi:uncharacterized cupredoxin-like copper-binding protein